jgi:hypothetical protein
VGEPKKSQASTAKEPLPDWKRVELLVAKLESVLGPSADIRSPDKIRDKDTKRPRQIDVSIRIAAGSVNLLVIMECRKRQRVSDATWIEQVAQKKVSVNADRAVVVGRIGEAAQEKAKALNVEYRTFEELSDPAIIRSLLPAVFCQVSCRWELIGGMKVDLDERPGAMDNKKFKYWLEEQTRRGMTSANARVFLHSSDLERPLTILEVFQREMGVNNVVWDSVSGDGSPLILDIHLNVAERLANGEYRLMNPDSYYLMAAGPQRPLIWRISSQMKLWKERSPDQTPDLVTVYGSSTNERPLKSGYFSFVDKGVEKVFVLHHLPDGRVAVQVTPKADDPVLADLIEKRSGPGPEKVL